MNKGDDPSEEHGARTEAVESVMSLHLEIQGESVMADESKIRRPLVVTLQICRILRDFLGLGLWSKDDLLIIEIILMHIARMDYTCGNRTGKTCDNAIHRASSVESLLRNRSALSPPKSEQNFCREIFSGHISHPIRQTPILLMQHPLPTRIQYNNS